MDVTQIVDRCMYVQQNSSEAVTSQLDRAVRAALNPYFKPLLIKLGLGMAMKTKKSVATSLVAIALVSGVLSHSVSAQESTSDVIKKHAPNGITATFYACVNQAMSNAIAAGACLSAEKDFQDKRLNAVYKKLLGALSEKDRPYLVAAERAWIGSKDKDRALETVVYGDEQVDNLQQTQNDVFRICERANTLERYLSLVADK